MVSWIIKFSKLALIYSTFGTSMLMAEPLAPSKLRTLCEKALIGSGLWNPPVRAFIVSTEGLDTSLEAAAYNPSSYELFFLNELSYYPPHFLSPNYLMKKRILDLTAGNGTLVEELRRYGLDAVGLSPLLTPYQLSKPYFIEASAMRTGLPERSADLIISTLGPLSLFWDDDPKMVLSILEEAKRVLRKGGTMLISPIHVPLSRIENQPDVSPQAVLAKTVFSELPEGLRIKSAPSRRWLETYRDAALDEGRPRRANYWLELERTD